MNIESDGCSMRSFVNICFFSWKLKGRNRTDCRVDLPEKCFICESEGFSHEYKYWWVFHQLWQTGFELTIHLNAITSLKWPRSTNWSWDLLTRTTNEFRIKRPNQKLFCALRTSRNLYNYKITIVLGKWIVFISFNKDRHTRVKKQLSYHFKYMKTHLFLHYEKCIHINSIITLDICSIREKGESKHDLAQGRRGSSLKVWAGAQPPIGTPEAGYWSDAHTEMRKKPARLNIMHEMYKYVPWRNISNGLYEGRRMVCHNTLINARGGSSWWSRNAFKGSHL